MLYMGHKNPTSFLSWSKTVKLRLAVRTKPNHPELKYLFITVEIVAFGHEELCE